MLPDDDILRGARHQLRGRARPAGAARGRVGAQHWLETGLRLYLLRHVLPGHVREHQHQRRDVLQRMIAAPQLLVLLRQIERWSPVSVDVRHCPDARVVHRHQRILERH